MHVIYEGVMPLNVKLILYRFVYEEGIFSIDTLNDRIFNFPFGRSELKNKPSKRIEQAHLRGTSKLPFSGSTMYTHVLHDRGSLYKQA